jgi:hypothetical protein
MADDRKAFEEFLKRDEKELTVADLGPDDFECNCEMCTLGWSIIPAGTDQKSG